MQPPLCLPSHAVTRAPSIRLPRASVDCHCHVFEDPARYPLGADRSYTPAFEPFSKYLKMCEVTGIERTVQVNSAIYGYDNSVTLDIIAAFGQHRARGVAGIGPDIEANELEKLHAGGMRGARLSTKVRGYGGTSLIDSIAPKLKPLGWHVDLHLGRNAELAELEARLLRVPVPLVFDHLGGVRGGEGPDAPGFRALLRILRQRDDCWVKLSSFYRLSDSGPPDYADMKAMAQAAVDARPDRVVWGSNWPHPNRYVDKDVPDDGDLIDVFCDWVPEAATRTRILVANPARLYRFP